MATQVQWRGGSTAEHATFTGAAREVTVDTQKQTLVLHDGSTAGGRPLLREDGSNAALSLGSAGTPSLKFTGDPNTGIYSPGADQVAVATNGTGRLFVSDNGVATGGAPQSGYGALQVRNSFIYLNEDGADTTQMYLRTVSNEAAIQVATNHPFKIQTNNQERLRITSAGLVGIGTSSPQQLLHVHNTSAADARLKISNGATGSTQFDGLEFNCASTGIAGIIQWEQQPIYLYTNDGSAVDPRLAITAAGNVGINTTSPSGQLSVTFNGNSVPGIVATDTGTPAAGNYYLLCGSSGGIQNVASNEIHHSAVSALAFRTGSGNGIERARIDSSGNVGIGSTVPNEKLTVADSGSANVYIALQNSTTGTTSADGWYLGAAGTEFQIYGKENGPITFSPNSSEKARLDASGRLLIGTSTSASTGAFAQYALLQVKGNTSNAASSGIINIQRGEGAGTITVGESLGLIDFTDIDGNSFGFVSCDADGTAGAGDYPGRFVFATTADGASTPTERLRIQASGDLRIANATTFYPQTDNAVSLGSGPAGPFRFSAVWAANGTIQTSDQRAKADVADAALGSEFIKSLRPVSYKWVEGGKYDTGERDEDGNFIYESVPGTRTHWGFIAQEVKQAVDATGVDFGGWLLTDKDDPDSQQALRYDQFIAPLTKALQEALEKIETLEGMVAVNNITIDEQQHQLSTLAARLTALETP
jgi:hypothetical protein